MKKTLLTIALAGLAVASTQAQGFVVFSSSTQNQSTNNVTGGSIVTDPALGGSAAGKTLGAGNYYYALFYSTSQTTVGGSAAATQGVAAESLALGTAAGWTFSNDYGISTATAGRFTAVNPNGDGTSTVAGLGGGVNAQFVILGWSANLGTTLAALQASILANAHGFLGQSAVSGTMAAGDGNLVLPPGIMSGGAPGIQAFTLGALPTVPEPGTLALAALGGASLLLFRRKK